MSAAGRRAPWLRWVQLGLGRGLHLGHLTDFLAKRFAGRAALHGFDADGGEERLDFEALEEAVARLAAAWRAQGVQPAEVVALAVPNRPALLLHVCALARVGALPAPVNRRLQQRELTQVIEATQASWLLAGPAVASVEGVQRIDPGALTAWQKSHPELRLRAEQSPSLEQYPDDVGLLLCTSGTTGRPKAAALTHRGLLASAGRLSILPLGLGYGPRGGRDRILAPLPLAHVMGLATALGALCGGVELVHSERFEAEQMLRLIERERPNVVVAVPTMYADMEAAGAERADLSSVQLWISGADVMPPARARRFQSFGRLIHLGIEPPGEPLRRRTALGAAAFVDIYGMVELSGPAAARLYPPGPAGLRLPALAAVLPGVQVRAVDPEGRPRRWGRRGELQFRGAGVLRHYQVADEDGARAMEVRDEAGWFSSGDYGRVWPLGVFAFSGRSRDRLKVGGFSVFPAEVEALLVQHPGVAEVALVGLPDGRLGERPVALVVRGPEGAGLSEEGYLAWAGAQVAGYRKPRQALFVDHLPRGNHGKIARAEATALAAELVG